MRRQSRNSASSMMATMGSRQQQQHFQLSEVAGTGVGVAVTVGIGVTTGVGVAVGTGVAVGDDTVIGVGMAGT